MGAEIKTYEDLNAVEQSAIEEKALLAQRKAQLQAQCQGLQSLVEGRRRILDTKRTASQSDASKALETQETKLRALEDNLFLMRETVAQKSAETNIAPTRDHCMGISDEIHTILAQG